MANTRLEAMISLRLPYMSERVPATTLMKIPVMVLDAAISPTSRSLAPRYWAKRERVGDLDMVELKMAKAPIRQSVRKDWESLSDDILNRNQS